MKKRDLQEAAQLSSSTVEKLTHGEKVNMAVLLKICAALQCDISDIMEIVPDGSRTSEEIMREGGMELSLSVWRGSFPQSEVKDICSPGNHAVFASYHGRTFDSDGVSL